MSDLDLTPTDGLTNSHIQFSRLEALPGGEALIVFAFTDESKRPAGEITVHVGIPPEQTVDAMIAEAHQELINRLRQWLYVASKSHATYAGRSRA